MVISSERLSEFWSKLPQTASQAGADLALRVPVLRGYMIDVLLNRLDGAYDEHELDADRLAYARWFGLHLRAFLHRLVDERPAAARALLRFVTTWTSDMSRRTAGRCGGDVAPATVVIEPTDRCNLLCPGCYAKSTRNGSDLPYPRIEAIVQACVDMGVTLITLSGGEPFLREKEDRVITRLAERYPRHGFLVYTNGTMIDEDIADRLGCVANVFPAISVEGFEHQTDRRRGRGISRQNRGVRRMLSDRGVMTGFSATVTCRNAEAVCTDAFIERRIEEGDLFGWFFLLQPIGRSPRPDLMVTADQRAMLRSTINRWRCEDRPIFLGDFWNDGHLVGGCIAGGTSYFHIYANGDISPCVFSPVACGNILDIIDGRSPYKTLREFVQDHPVFRAYRREQSGITDRDRPCLLIDHPEAFRRLWKVRGCRAAKNMPPGYADGEIADCIDRAACDWATRTADLMPLPYQQTDRAEQSA